MGWDPCVRGHTVGTRLGPKAWEMCRYLAVYIVAAKSKMLHAWLCINKEFTFKTHGLIRGGKAVNERRRDLLLL